MEKVELNLFELAKVAGGTDVVFDADVCVCKVTGATGRNEYTYTEVDGTALTIGDPQSWPACQTKCFSKLAKDFDIAIVSFGEFKAGGVGTGGA